MSIEGKPKAFVLMPFDEDLVWAYDSLIYPAFDAAGYTVTRADEIPNQQSIMKDIVTAIVDSDLIVAELSRANANVYYELGVAHALRKPVLMLSHDVSQAAFDIRSYRAFVYEVRPDRFEDAKERLTAKAREISCGRVAFGNPVSDFSSEKSSKPATAEGSSQDEDEDKAVEAEEELGALDLVDAINQGFEEQTKWLADGTSLLKLLGEHASRQTPILKSLAAAKNLTGFRVVLRETAAFFDAKASELHDINKGLRSSWERTSNALERRFQHSMAGPGDQAALLTLASGLSAKALEARSSMVSFRGSMDTVPNVDSMLTRSKRRLAGKVDVLVGYMDDVASFENRLTAAALPGVGKLSAGEQAELLSAAKPCAACGREEFQVSKHSVAWEGAEYAKRGKVVLTCEGCGHNQWIEVSRSEQGELVILRREED